jgi:hypothetical protein
MQAVYHSKAGQLLFPKGEKVSNGIIYHQPIRTRFFDTEVEARKYAERYLKGYEFIVNDL